MTNNIENRIIATPRVYYHEQKLQGNSIETDAINLRVFDYIINNSLSEAYVTQPTTKVVKTEKGLESVSVELFKYCTIRKDGIHYDGKDGSFYLPEAIIMFEMNDSLPFPSEFYFIAKINNQLELSHCRGGREVKWYQLADTLSSVVEQEIMNKAEKTISYLKDYIEFEIKEQQTSFSN